MFERVQMFRSLLGGWRYRHFIISSIRNDFVSRFSRSRFGAVWMVLQPLAMVLIYALILSAVLSARLPGIESQYAYAIYLTAGILPWTLFLEVVSRSLTMFIDNSGLIKKISFPRLALPCIVLGGALVNYFILFFCAIAVFYLLGYGVGYAIVWIVPLTLMTALFSVGVGLVLGVLNVFIRDVGQVMSIAFQFLFWLTPIVYPVSIVPGAISVGLVFNPLYHIVDAYHQVMVYQQAPSGIALTTMILVSGAVMAFGLLLFRKASAEMVDAL